MGNGKKKISNLKGTYMIIHKEIMYINMQINATYMYN